MGFKSFRIHQKEKCSICYKELTGELGKCPKCSNILHFVCLTQWVSEKEECPQCRNELLIEEVIIHRESDFAKIPTEIFKCQICNRNFNTEDKILICNSCSSNFHPPEFLEWIKTNGSCPICGSKIQF